MQEQQEQALAEMKRAVSHAASFSGGNISARIVMTWIARLESLSTPPVSPAPQALLACAHCGKPAACFGVYEQQDRPVQLACDDCCGHGNEDGWCAPLDKFPELLTTQRQMIAKLAPQAPAMAVSPAPQDELRCAFCKRVPPPPQVVTDDEQVAVCFECIRKFAFRRDRTPQAPVMEPLREWHPTPAEMVVIKRALSFYVNTGTPWARYNEHLAEARQLLTALLTAAPPQEKP